MRKIPLLLLLALSILAIPSWAQQDNPFPTEKHRPQLSGFFDFQTIPIPPGVGQITKGNCITSSATQPAIYAGNFLIDCDGETPHNETPIAVDPASPVHAIGGMNDYRLNFVGNTVIEHVISCVSVTFNGGDSWHQVTPPVLPYQSSGDPALAFDARSRIYLGSIANHQAQNAGGNFTAPDIVVTHSDDGGLTWSGLSLVARGQGASTKSNTPKIFNDKDYIAADRFPSSPQTNRVYVSWTRFLEDLHGSSQFVHSPIYVAYSDNGTSWSTPKAISGFNPACNATISGLPNQCDLNQDSYPAVAPNGRVYVSFENFNTVAENQAMVVWSDNGGVSWHSPVRIDTLFDINYPINTDGRSTLSGCNFRYSVKANTATDPSDSSGNTVYVVWADNRNGSSTTTNTDVFLGRSTDGGNTWTTYTVDSTANDQFYPWVAVDNSGVVNVGYMDRSYSSGQSVCQYGFTVSRLIFSGTTATTTRTRVDTHLSDPGHSRWFSTATNPSSRFIGDYNGLDVGSDSAAWSLWTDERNIVANPPSPLRNHGQHAVGDVLH
jgi:hypothetical protein